VVQNIGIKTFIEAEPCLVKGCIAPLWRCEKAWLSFVDGVDYLGRSATGQSRKKMQHCKPIFNTLSREVLPTETRLVFQGTDYRPKS
jgi:hypothetical protein